MQFDFYCQLCMKRGCIHAGEPMRDKPIISSVLADIEAKLRAEWENQEADMTTIRKASSLVNYDEAKRLMAEECLFRKGKQAGLHLAIKQVMQLRGLEE